MEQAKQIVKDLIEQGAPKSGTIKDSSGKEIALEETQIVALIAYIQRVGVLFFHRHGTTN